MKVDDTQQTPVQCQQCGEVRDRVVSDVYDSGDRTLLDCGRCRRRTEHEVCV